MGGWRRGGGQKGGGPKGGGPEGWGPEGRGPEGWGPNPEKVGATRVGPRRVGPRRVGGPKFRVFFFFPCPAAKFVFFSLSGGLLVEFWWCLKRRGRSNVHVWSSRAVVCEPRRPHMAPLPKHNNEMENARTRAVVDVVCLCH